MLDLALEIDRGAALWFGQMNTPILQRVFEELKTEEMNFKG